MKTYDKYKPSGIDWIGDIPEHWKIERAKWIFSESKDRNRDLLYSEKNLLSVSEYYGVGQRVEKISQDDILNRSESLTEYKTVKPGNLVINIMLAWKKGLGVSDFEGISSPSYCVFEILNETFSPKYFHYLYRTDLYAEVFRQNSTGIIESRLRLYPEEFFNVLTIIPTSDEQKAIANYLDEKTAQIDSLITNKVQLIDLLKEERAATINQAVTRGIKPHAKLKPSGIAWLGDIPRHWEVKKLKFLGEAIIGITYSPDDVSVYENDLLVLRSSNIQNGVLEFNDCVYVSKEVKEKHLTKAGDILICARNGSAHLVGKSALIDEKSAGLSFGAFMTVFRSHFGKFLYWFFNSEMFKAQTGLFSTSTINQLTSDTLNNLLIVIPPIDEQEQIIEFIETATRKIDATIAKVEKEIGFMREYRTALISEVVTGKIKVV